MDEVPKTEENRKSDEENKGWPGERRPESITPKEDDGLKNSSKAVFRFLNPDGKSKLKQAEILQYMKKLHDGGNHEPEGNAARHWHDATKAVKNQHVRKVIHKFVGAKGGKSIKESDLEMLNKRFMAGHLPRIGRDPDHLVQQEDEESEEEDDGDDESDADNLRKEIKPKDGFLYKSVSFSLKTALILKDYMVNAVSKAGMTWLTSILPTSQISTLFTFLLFSYVITASFLSWFIPLAILWFSMGIMVVSTMRMVRGVKRFAEFRAWAEFLDFVGSTQPNSIDTSKAEENYLLNHLSMYAQFIIGTAFCVMGYGVSNKMWVLNAELAILSLIMYGSIVYIYNLHKNFTSVIVCFCQILATLFEGFHRTGGSEVFGHIVSVQLPWLGIGLHASLPVILRAFIFFSIVSLPRRKSYRNLKVGLIQLVLPHVVAVLWFETAAMFFSNCSLYSVVRAAFEYFTLLFAMPVFFVLFLFAVLKLLLSFNYMKVVITSALIIVPMIYFKVWRNKKQLLHFIGKTFGANTTKAVLILIGSLAFGWLMVSYRPSGMLVPNSNLTWNEYRGLCIHPKKSYPGNPVPVTIACNEFKGYVVQWKGLVKYVQIAHIDNKVESLLNVLPGSVASWLSCVYGRPYPESQQCQDMKASKVISSPDTSLCAVAEHARRECHLQDYNMYKFIVGVAMPKGNKTSLDDTVVVDLEVSNDFRQVVFELRKGSPLEFKGVLISDKPAVSAKILYTRTEDDEIKGHVKRYKRIERSLGVMVDEAVDALTTFLLYPAITFLEEAPTD